MKYVIAGIVGMGLLALAIAGGSTGMAQQNKDQDKDKDKDQNQADPRSYSTAGYDLERLDAERIEELANELSPMERSVLLGEGTERAFSGPLYDNKEAGLYTCHLCGLPLFSSETKFKSGTGWPSFFEPFDPAHVHQESDAKFGMTRTEIECQRCRSHLGHLFDDGPKPTGLRYCINSAALQFHKQGADLPPQSRPIALAVAYFAGGCFWGIEDRFQQVPGVVDAVSGYQGGALPDPNYKQVCSGTTGHVESVRVRFDEAQVPYRQLLEWFFKFHDATQVNRQGPDIGTQYRSAIFTANVGQQREATAYLAELQQSQEYRDRKIATQIEPAAPFYEAEEYHQDYHAKHGGSCAIPLRK